MREALSVVVVAVVVVFVVVDLDMMTASGERSA